MYLGEKVIDRLTYLQITEGLRGPSEQRREYLVEVREEGTYAKVRVSDFDKYTYLCDHLELGLLKGSERSHGVKLREKADEVASKITYLLEKLFPLEIDESSHKALLRSKPPERRDGEIRYYELIIEKGCHLTLSRYCYSQRKRRRIPMSLPVEILERLIDDLAGIINP